MESGGWVIYTNFWFGRREPLINYDHGIATKSTFAQKGAKGLYHAQFSVGIMLSLCSWLGICSQTQWEHLLTEDVSVACDALVKHCAHFFEVVECSL
jgi:hypothetical protein